MSAIPEIGKPIGSSGISLYEPPDSGDVVNEYNWTVTGKRKTAREETPRIELEEWQQTTAAIEQEIRFWVKQANQVANNKSLKTNPYEKMYTARRTGNMYTLPFYNPYNHAIMNNWGSNKGIAGSAIDMTLVEVAKVLFPSTGIESPKVWEGTQIATYSFSFDLLNTVDDTDIDKNLKLIRAFTYANLPDRINSVAAFPPVLYTVNIPGVRYSPAAVIANFTVENLGQINYIKNENIPDAYRLTLNIAELITESRRLYKDTFDPINGKVTTAIVEPDETTTEGLDERAVTKFTKEISTIETTLNEIKNKYNNKQ